MRLLDAARLSGSSQNKQPWRFVVVETRELVERLAECVYAPANVLGARLVVAILHKGFDLGRCAQNMMLAAWNDGVASCPNGIKNVERATQLLGGEPGIVISFGYLARARDAHARPAEEWSARAKRKSLGSLVERR